jgi:hypothetical protein
MRDGDSTIPHIMHAQNSVRGYRCLAKSGYGLEIHRVTRPST